jgi:hypothetical protein
VAVPEFVDVPVPVERVLEVYALLARQPSFATVVAKEGYPEGWSDELIDRMFVESSGAMRRILVAIARSAPGWATTEEVARAAGLTVRQAVASLGPFEKRVRGRYRMNRWPFAAREFVDPGIVKYSMSIQTAERILELEVQLEEHGKGGAS